MKRLTGDEGSVLLLVLGYAVIAGLLVVVAIDASAVFLARRSLVAVADGAAVAAVQAVDEAALYEGRDVDGTLPLAAGEVEATVAAYARDVARRYPGIEVVGRSPDGRTVVVDARRTISLPFGGAVGVATVTVTARATAETATVG